MEGVSNIYQRINAAALALRHDPWVIDLSAGQYKSVSIAQIREHVGRAEADAGIVVIHTETESGWVEVPDAKESKLGGKTSAMYAVVGATLTYVNVDDPSDRVDFSRHAKVVFGGGKEYHVAETMLYKNHYKALYHIAERDSDDDAHDSEETDLITVFRGDANAREQILAIVNARAEAVRKRVEQEERERQELARKQKARVLQEQAKSDAFFGKPTAEAKVEKVEDKTDADTEADFVRASDFDDTRKTQQAKARAEVSRSRILEHMANHPDDETVAFYVADYGADVSKWAPGVCIHCWEEVMDARRGSQ